MAYLPTFRVKLVYLNNIYDTSGFAGRVQEKVSFQNQLRTKDMHAHLFSEKMKQNIFLGTRDKRL